MADPGLILVSGGAGVMGSRLVRQLAAAGHRVRVLTLPGDPGLARLKDVPCEIVTGDIADAAALEGIFDGVGTVYHLAALIIAPNDALLQRVNVEGTRNMAAGAAAAGVRHFIYVSSAAAADPAGSVYAQTKAEAERIVKAAGVFRYTIVRPTLVYARDGGQEFMMFRKYLRKFPVIPFIGRGRAMKRPVHVDDMGQGLLALAGNGKSYGKTYNFSGGEAISIWDLARLILRLEGRYRPFIAVPLPLCRAIAWVMEHTMARPPLTRYAISRIEHEAATDNTEAQDDLGIRFRGVTEGLRQCLGAGDS
ncbi:MAG: NAD-dependent epimerase/dehydratase family protein [Kiritimatiellia bacterium]|jgi:NADH dehydrogenase